VKLLKLITYAIYLIARIWVLIFLRRNFDVHCVRHGHAFGKSVNDLLRVDKSTLPSPFPLRLVHIKISW